METDTRTFKILVTDDDPTIRHLFGRFLDKLGYEVSEAADGPAALSKIKEVGYDMLILDLKMPGMDGMEVIKEIRERDQELIIITITGHATISTAKEAIKLGCFDYITKPFDIDATTATIRRAFGIRTLIEERQRLQEQIQVSERLAALAEMGAGVAHEVNTVLASVKLFLEMLKAKMTGKKEDSHTDLILEEVRRAEELIARFLKFTKPPETRPVQAGVNAIIDRSLQFLDYRLKKHDIRVVRQMDEGLPQVLCDPAAMEEVFLNIFCNSIDAMSPKGTLTIRSRAEKKNIAVVISDTGVGIPPGNMGLLYNPFFTTKTDGTGLGLSIAHRIINDHNGSIEITSKENQGSVVRIALPACG